MWMRTLENLTRLIFLFTCSYHPKQKINPVLIWTKAVMIRNESLEFNQEIYNESIVRIINKNIARKTESMNAIYRIHR